MRATLSTLVAAVLLTPSAHADVSGTDIVAFVNAERTANGLPAEIAEDTRMSCQVRLTVFAGDDADVFERGVRIR
jgi:hypothetical protein